MNTTFCISILTILICAVFHNNAQTVYSITKEESSISGVTSDSSGNFIYIGSYSTGGSLSWLSSSNWNGSADGYVVSYAPNGTRLWGFSFGGEGDDYPNCIARDSSDDIVVGGSSSSDLLQWRQPTSEYTTKLGSGADMFLAKYDSSGNFLGGWFSGYSSTDTESVNGLAIASDNTIYACGTFSGAWGAQIGRGSNDWVILKFSFNGSSFTLLKQQTFGGSGDDTAYSIAVDSNSYIYITGYYTSSDMMLNTTNTLPASPGDPLLLKMSGSSFGLIWYRVIDCTASGYGYSVKVDCSDDVVLAGQCTDYAVVDGTPVGDIQNGLYNAILAKFDSNSSLIWGSIYGGTGGNSAAGDVAIGSGNAIYTVGMENNSDFNLGGANLSYTATYSLWIAKHSSSGIHEWSQGTDRLGNGLYGPRVASDGYYIATGAAYNEWAYINSENFTGPAALYVIFTDGTQVPSPSPSRSSSPSPVTNLYTTVTMVIEGLVSDFNSTYFLNSIAAVLNITDTTVLELQTAQKRVSVVFRIYDRSGVDSAKKAQDLGVIAAESQSDLIQVYNILTISFNADFSHAANPPEEDKSSSSSSNATNMVIIAVVVPVGVVAAGIAVVGIIVVKRKRAVKTAADDEAPRKSDLEMGNPPAEDISALEPAPKKKRKTKKWEISYTELLVDKELGRGAFGVVYLAKWRNTACVVKQLESSSASVEAFLKEARNVKNLRPHPNICQILGVCMNPEYPMCIVMEYVPHGSLWTMIVEKKIDINLDMTLDFAMDIASGMSHLHSENIVHCDLACRNLLVAAKTDNKYQIKITDFGLSRVTDQDIYNADKDALFPVRWTAPETIRARIVSKPMDVWSYGITLWEMIEAKQPYPEMSNTQVINQVCDRGQRLPKPQRIEVPDSLYALMQQCWKDDPKERPTFNELCEQLSSIEKEVRGVNSWASFKQEPEHKGLDSTYGNQPVGEEITDSAEVAVYGNNIEQRTGVYNQV